MRVSAAQYVRLCAEEPFRIFFPLGALLGFTGVLLWPLFFAGVIVTYPGIAHARVMIEGFMSCFIFGFLGTAGPRVMSVRHFSSGEVMRLIVALLASIGAHLAGNHALGDLLFVVTMCLFAGSLLPRFLAREDSPSPNFALVALGMLNGIAGAALLFWSQAFGAHPDVYRLGNSLLNIGFVLLPVLGVAPFFLRRLLDLPSDETPTTRGQLAIALLLGVAIVASFVFELVTSAEAVGWIRAVLVVIYLTIALPLRGNSTLAAGLRMSLAAMAAALGLVAILSPYRVSALHVLFIGGFSVAVFIVATRVVLGHSGKLANVRRQRWLFVTALVLIILAMISRFSADFVATRNEHLNWAAYCWLLGAAIWVALVLPKVRVVEN